MDPEDGATLGRPDLTTSAAQDVRRNRNHCPMHARRTLVFCLVLAVTAPHGTAAIAASDMPHGVKSRRHRADTPKPVQATRARQPVSCGQFGPGFVRMAGSDTCISVGGAVDVGIGVGVGR